jgi:2,3-bisphosphoglycerate-independent phosphoglycerate mutase
LDLLASRSELGLTNPVEEGITPGSGPGHLGLFGYDPLETIIGRGVLGGLGVDFPMEVGDLAVRVNFCTLDENGIVIDRRAGRLATSENERLCQRIREKVNPPPGVEFFFKTEKEHRALLVLRGSNVSEAVCETDPLSTGFPPVFPKALSNAGETTSRHLHTILNQISEILKEETVANMVLLRGYAVYQKIESMQERFGLNPVAVTEYPMYRGLAKLVGMRTTQPYSSLEEGIGLVKQLWNEHDFFFLHFKKTDSAGEDANFQAKVAALEVVDRHIPLILALKADVLVIAGDHSTPAAFGNHSWHPVPFLLSAKYVRPSRARRFDEEACLTHGLWPNLAAKNLIALMLANSNKLKKFGA